ncbi:MAG: type VI secretion system baseplate subunit TssF [Pirellulaceae bacterium]
MSIRLENEYENELAAIRKLGREFAQQRPAIAGRLMLSDDTGVSQDPHVERLIEAFAFLTARLQVKLKDEFPELVDALLGMLYPHYLAPIPSMAIAQLHLDASQAGLTTGPTIPSQTEMFSREIAGVSCRFRTTMPTTLWPLKVERSRYESSPFGADVVTPPASRDAEGALRIELTCTGAAPLHKLGIRGLRFFLSGDLPTTTQLYELVFNHVTNVLIRVPDAPPARSMAVLPPSAIHPVGFLDEEGMLPYGPRSFPGYRLLSEYFAFPQKFLFFDLTSLECLERLAANQSVELILFLNRAAPQLESRVKADTFRLGCTPVVNLFTQSAAPIRLTRTKTQNLVVPHVSWHEALEVYSIDEVESIHPETRQVVRYEPFYSLRDHSKVSEEIAFWYHYREPSVQAGDPGTDVYLALVDSHFQPTQPATEIVLVKTTCTNRNLPADVQKTGSVDWQFQLAGQSPVRRITTPVEPTRPLRLPAKTNRWRLVSHLALNHLSITGGPDGAAALREVLRLYDYTQSSSTAQQIDGLFAVGCGRGIAPIREGHIRGFCRGLDVTVTFDDERYPGTGFYLLASVLERFLAQYTSINSFTRLIARSKQREYWEKRWTPRTGNLTLA